MNKQKLIDKLEPYAQGCFSGNVSEWLELKPLLRDIYNFLRGDKLKGGNMFSVEQKREIADQVQRILRETNHPELPEGEINFHLHVDGAESGSYADIKNNGAVLNPSVNPWNEKQAEKNKTK